MKIRISTCAGETLVLIDAQALLYMGFAKPFNAPEFPRLPPGRVLIIEAVSSDQAVVLRRANSRDCIDGHGFAMSEIFTVKQQSDE